LYSRDAYFESWTGHGFLIAVLRELTQSIQAHPMLVPKLGDDLTLSNPYKFINVVVLGKKTNSLITTFDATQAKLRGAMDHLASQSTAKQSTKTED